MRIALVVLVLVHAAIHGIGLQRYERPVGLLWLGAGVVLAVSGALLLARQPAWWLVALVGAVFSQVLIVSAWSDARFGTVANAIILVAALLSWADARFQADGDAAIRDLLASVPTGPSPVVTHDDLAALPAPVRRWLETSGVVGKPRVRVVRLRQRGLLRTGPDQAPMPADAEQVFTVDEPGFVWRVRVAMMRVLPIAGRDEYRDGRGHMRIAAASLIPIVDASGPAIDQGTLLRYLGETVWFPSAALAPYLRWEPVDATSARATMSHRGVTATATFVFDPDGRFVRLTARRYLGGGADAVLRDWAVTASRWREMAGVRIPVEGSVTWRLPAGDFEYYRWEITGVEYD